MGGVLVTSIVSGNLITKFGRYRPFPILGTALMTVAMFLLSTLVVDTPIWHTAVFMVVLGLGLGMTMQVLVLVAQNAVDYRNIGVATSGSTLFRQIGGSIGVAAFGAIFANRLGHELASRLPSGFHAPKAVNPTLVRHLPPAIHKPYIEGLAASLHPVFLMATGIAFLAFVLTWMLREVPLREKTRFEAAGDAIPAPTAASEPAPAR
jgi:MFS family permease